jgi:hypothetical protein
MRIGNGAFDQRQNDVFGAVLDSILLHLPRSRPAAASAMADRPVAGPLRYGVWREPFDDRLRSFLSRTTYQVSSVSGSTVGPCCSVCVGQPADDVGVGLAMMGASDVRRVTFWGQALGYLPREEPDGTWVVLRPVDGPGRTPRSRFPRHRCRSGHGVHLDLYANDQTAEIERLLGLGASGVHGQDYPKGADFVLLAGTEGNRIRAVAHG